jgi:hypothetical protein
VRPRFRFGSENLNRLEAKNRHDFDCFASKRNSKNLKQKKRELSVSAMLRVLKNVFFYRFQVKTKNAERN